MTAYKKTIATLVLASMLIASVAYAEEAQAEEAQAEDHATRSLMHGPLHPKMFQAGRALGKFGRFESRMGRHAIGNGYPALGLAGMASGFGNRGAGKILRRAGKFGWGGPHFGRKLQEAEEAEEQYGRKLLHGSILHPRMFRAGRALGKFGRWENRMGRNAFGNGHPALGLAGMASGFGNRSAGKILRRAGQGQGLFGGFGGGGFGK